MFKISEFNPKDKTLDEIHTIQRKIYEEDKGLSSEEIIQKYKNIRRDLSERYNLSFRIISHKGSIR